MSFSCCHGMACMNMLLLIFQVCSYLLTRACIQVTGVEVVAGSENKFPTSHSAILRLARQDADSSTLFVKKVSCKAMEHKPWADRRRTLAYSRTGAHPLTFLALRSVEGNAKYEYRSGQARRCVRGSLLARCPPNPTARNPALHARTHARTHTHTHKQR